jgi:AraC-like DNA-binding protein
MNPIILRTIPAPESLKKEVECFRIFDYKGEEAFAIKVAPIAVPGIVFQHKNGKSAIKNFITSWGVNASVSMSFIYGAGTTHSIMNYKKGPFTTIQVILKPHALQSIFGIDASTMTDKRIDLNKFSGQDLNSQLLEAQTYKKQIALLTKFLVTQKKQAKTKDVLVEKSLALINKHIASIDVKYLVTALNISERQLEKRFTETVGIPPQSYIRVKRFNEAVRLMKTKKFERLTDVAHALNYYDQSHFIRDLKDFTGITPKSIFQKVDNFHEQGGFSYV